MGAAQAAREIRMGQTLACRETTSQRGPAHPPRSARSDEPGPASSPTHPANQFATHESGSSPERVQSGVHIATVAESTDLGLVPLRLAGQARHASAGCTAGVACPSPPASSVAGRSGSIAIGRPSPIRSTARPAEQLLHRRAGSDAASQHDRHVGRSASGPGWRRPRSRPPCALAAPRATAASTPSPRRAGLS